MRSREEFEKLVYEKVSIGRLKEKRRKKAKIGAVGTFAALASLVLICIPIFPRLFPDKANGVENSNSYGIDKNATDTAESPKVLQSVTYSDSDMQKSVPGDKNKAETERLFDFLRSVCDENPTSKEPDAAPLCSVRFDFGGGKAAVGYRIYNGFISDGTDYFVISDTDRIFIEKSLISLGLIDE